MGALFLIEYPLVWLDGKKWALIDFLAEKGHIGEYGLATFYSKVKSTSSSGIDEVTGESLNYTHWSEGAAWNPFAYTYIGVALTPSMFAIGWFMKLELHSW